MQFISSFMQTWDLLQIMYKGFTGLCKDILNDHPGYFISPLRINGSAVETIFSSLKYICGGTCRQRTILHHLQPLPHKEI